MVKLLTANGSTLINHKKAIVKIQDDFKIWRNVRQSIENQVEAIQNDMWAILTKRD